MAREMTSRALFLILFAIFVHFQSVVTLVAYEIPDVTVRALSPKGLLVSIPDSPNVGLFAFNGHVNREISSNDVGTLSGESTQSTDGRWVVDISDVTLKSGDVINYYVFVSKDGVGYVKDKLSFTVKELEDASTRLSIPSIPSPTCQPTLTRVRGGTACAGQVIFEDHFDSLREDLWQIQHYMPVDHPEYPFVSYQRPAVSVRDGHLHITPMLQQNQPAFTYDSIFKGALDLYEGCTGSATECFLQAAGSRILPPIISGRITSRVHFTYGIVHVRAKLPFGDWIYPEILLEPFLKKYGNLNYMSGVMKIAAARGNKSLWSGSKNLSNMVLYGGPIMDLQCREQLLKKKELDGKYWADEFHIYSIKWTQRSIELLVDDELWGRVEVTDNLRSLYGSHCNLPRNLLAAGSKMAPFDEFFYVTLGVAAGGTTEFLDGAINQASIEKPWRNHGSKATLQFWQDMPYWLPTWNDTALLVDYVKIVAL